MPQQPFTTAGVQQKVSDLYQLPQNQRIAEANLIRSDFATWLNNNFTLSQTQQTYLSQMDSQFTQESGDAVGLAVQFELPITLTFSGAGQTKLVHRDAPIKITYNVASGLSATGQVDFSIEYQ